ncbi:hypothetical protein [Arenimonas fontis]|uniref:Aspartyl protease n=1 Tax=Arenimonas fontis TaxID=2608255 RepID=A0A5B2ZBQ1_9GAMM|nr:hypothetical protein [Arenimonas fontis]KAA2284710.1 hypothetical protein F0415_08400 [Arenimonas fontis]
MPLTRPLMIACLALGLAAGHSHADVPLPARFEADQVWLVPRLDGRELRLFTDTGGGWNAIGREIAEAAGWPIEVVDTGQGELAVVPFPAFDEGHGIPAPPAHFMQGRLALAEPARLFGGDGFLGGRWFADGIWDFDYPAGTLTRRDAAVPPAGSHAVPLGFQVDAAGRRTTHFPSMDIVVDGETLPVLLDTGATAHLTENSAPLFGREPDDMMGVSFIEQEVFERWVRRHPDWRVIEAGDRKGPQLRRMIEVPAVTIAGYTVGPVWFSEQPAGAFQQYMATMMDRPTWGAIGGSALKHFRVLVDYPGATAHFLPADAAGDATGRHTDAGDGKAGG